MLNKKVLKILLVVVGILGAGLSVIMLISAIHMLEWGRVVLYCVTLAVFVEMAVINILKLRSMASEK